MKAQQPHQTRGDATRERLVAEAARQFRTAGFSKTSIGSVMREIGLTHGGFYAHFASKDDLFAAAVTHATNASGDWLEAQVEDLEGDAWVEAWVDIYLSDKHCANPAGGCPLPSMLPEVTRGGESARAAFAEALARRLGRVRRFLPFPPEEAERRFVSAYAHMAGAVMLSRVIGVEASAQLRQDVAASVKSMLLDSDPSHLQR